MAVDKCIAINRNDSYLAVPVVLETELEKLLQAIAIVQALNDYYDFEVYDHFGKEFCGSHHSASYKLSVLLTEESGRLHDVFNPVLSANVTFQDVIDLVVLGKEINLAFKGFVNYSRGSKLLTITLGDTLLGIWYYVEAGNFSGWVDPREASNVSNEEIEVTPHQELRAALAEFLRDVESQESKELEAVIRKSRQLLQEIDKLQKRLSSS